MLLFDQFMKGFAGMFDHSASEDAAELAAFRVREILVQRFLYAAAQLPQLEALVASEGYPVFPVADVTSDLLVEVRDAAHAVRQYNLHIHPIVEERRLKCSTKL